MKANNREQAWEITNEIFPTDYIKNEAKSKRAGYDIYESTAEGVLAWISDLSDRLEVNLDNGKTITIKGKFIKNQWNKKIYTSK